MAADWPRRLTVGGMAKIFMLELVERVGEKAKLAALPASKLVVTV